MSGQSKGGWKEMLLLHADLSPHTRVVGLVLCEVWGSSKPPFDRMRPSVPTLARTAGVSERSCQTALRELMKRGLLHVVRAGGAIAGRNWATEYRLGWPLEPGEVVQEMHHPLVQEMHQGGARDAPGVVQEMHPNPGQLNPGQGESAPETQQADRADTAEAVVAEWSGRTQPPREVRAQVAKHVTSLLVQDIPASDVREGLRDMEAKALGVQLLPSLVHEAGARRRSKHDQRDLQPAYSEGPAPEPTWAD